MRDYTLVVYLDSEHRRFDEYLHVDVHGVKECCLHIHFMPGGPNLPYIIPNHAYHLAMPLER